MFTRSRALEAGRLTQFGVAGLLNTIVGYVVTVSALGLGASDVPANVAGYAVGLTLSYVLQRQWVFRDAAARGMASVLRFLVMFAVAYGANLAVILMAGKLGYERQPLVHLLGACVYTTLFYIGAKTFVFSDATDRSAILRSWWPELLITGILALGWGLLRVVPVSHDVVWQLWVARQVLGGAKLYSEIIEINPPLWFWTAMPIQRIAEALGAPAKQVLVTGVFCYVLAAVLAIAALLRKVAARNRAVLLTLIVVTLVLVPLAEFGQREHLVLIGTLPYAFLLARRAEGATVHWLLAIAIGVLAAYGFALKQYFIIVPVLLEAWLIWERRRAWSPFRPETLTIGLAALLYAGAVFRYAPDYLTLMVPMVKLAYGGYDGSWSYMLLKNFVVFWGLIFLVLLRVRSVLSPFGKSAAIAGFGFVLAYFIQRKGFDYHSIPANGVLLIALMTVVTLQAVDRLSRRLIYVLAIMPMLVFAVRGPYYNANEPRVAHLLDGVERGKTVMMLAQMPSVIWPMIEDRGYVWPSRYFISWMLATFAQDIKAHGTLSPELARFAQQVRTEMVQDLSCNPPDRIIVDDLSGGLADGLDAIQFFSVDPKFRALFSHYKKRQIWGRFTSYHRDAAWKPVATGSCRPIF